MIGIAVGDADGAATRRLTDPVAPPAALEVKVSMQEEMFRTGVIVNVVPATAGGCGAGGAAGGEATIEIAAPQFTASVATKYVPAGAPLCETVKLCAAPDPRLWKFGFPAIESALAEGLGVGVAVAEPVGAGVAVGVVVGVGLEVADEGIGVGVVTATTAEVDVVLQAAKSMPAPANAKRSLRMLSPPRR